MEKVAQESNSDITAEAGTADTNPSVTFESITFSDGTEITLGSTDVVVLVGPNNAGKSAALRELQHYVNSGNRVQQNVIRRVSLRMDGTDEDVRSYVQRNAEKRSESGVTTYRGYRMAIQAQQIQPSWSKGRQGKGIGALTSVFCQQLQTQNRITGCNAAEAISFLKTNPNNPIHMLYLDDDLERKISRYFEQAFGQELSAYRLGGNQIPLRVGEIPPLQDGEDRISKSYNERLIRLTTPLDEQGDGMRSFATVILHLLVPTTPSILIIDEPEAFLHPPQAKLLGELIAKERSPGSQLFVATHSPDVVQGLLNEAPDNLRMIRMRREGNINRVTELDKQRAKEISFDPLMKYSSALAGVFHERVIICESDSDCMFYSSILDLPSVRGDMNPDVLFVHANGKARMAKLARALRELDVPVDVIADIDIIKSEDLFQELIELLGGDWNEVQPMARSVVKAIEQKPGTLNPDETKKAILDYVKAAQPTESFPKDVRSAINKIVGKASPWDQVKTAGVRAIPQGDATQNFNELLRYCERWRLWIVPVGELEGFCRSIGGHGPKWVQKLIEDRDLSTDPELQGARVFVRKVWRN